MLNKLGKFTLDFHLDFPQVAATSTNQEEEEEDEPEQQKQGEQHTKDGIAVSSSEQQHRYQQQQWIGLTILLQPFHYINGQLNLRCTAQIPGIYSSMNEIQLGAGLREPVPERGTHILSIFSFTLLMSKLRRL
ncbi:hypothetical protein M0802_005865 [Mischocyttarus mexicanus]|nr:hypothetical protein M0802_005865 [Mischocyttarus mexicanus]